MSFEARHRPNSSCAVEKYVYPLVYCMLFFCVCVCRFPECDVGRLSAMILGLAQLTAKVPNKWSSELLSSFHQLLPTAKPYHICLLVTGLARVYVAPEGTAAWLNTQEGASGRKQQVQACVAALGRDLGKLKAGQLLGVIEAVVKLQVPVEQWWLERHKAAAEELGELATAEQRVRMVKAYSQIARSMQVSGSAVGIQ